MPDPLGQRLVHPLLQLLYSPALDLLAMMQHVLVAAGASIRQWHSHSASIPPVHMLPMSMGPDAADAEVAMQVGGWGGASEFSTGRESILG